MRSYLCVVLLATAACAGSGDSSAPTSGSGGGGGGNVSFGGAQDIGEFRATLDRGEIPASNTLDANGFFNEHFNQTPPATCGGTLCLTPGLSVGRDWLTGKHQATLQIAVNTNVDPTTFHRLPLNLVVVVDHSGSMASDQRLDKVKTGLHTMVEQYVTYGHRLEQYIADTARMTWDMLDRERTVTDEASAVEALGLRPRLVAGGPGNVKITLPGDRALAAAVLATMGGGKGENRLRIRRPRA